MQQPSIGWAHRLRATALGGVLLVVALIAAGLAATRARAEYDRLSERMTIGGTEAAILLLWVALALVLLWAAIVIAVAVLSVARNDHGNGRTDGGHSLEPGTPGRTRTPGAAMWTVGVLLTLTSLTTGTSAASASPASAATTVATSSTTPPVTTSDAAPGTSATPQVPGDDSIPAPSFSTSPKAVDTAPDAIDQPAAGTESPTIATPSAAKAGCDIPLPSWLPKNPGRTSQRAQDSASLITGCGAPDESDTVVVRRGDTLWSIAAAHLGPAADATTVAEEWPRWYAANRDVIGDDPDVLLVGQQLHAPDRVLEGTK